MLRKKTKVVKQQEVKEVRPKVFIPGKIPSETKTFGQSAADRLTVWAGSWTFIISLLIVIALWVILNVSAYVNQWDPWPFIVLNLCLSCLAAMQAPIILMSQNRSEQKDRIRQEYDYAVDRKSLSQTNKVLKEITYLRSDVNVLMAKYEIAKRASTSAKAKKKKKK